MKRLGTDKPGVSHSCLLKRRMLRKQLFEIARIGIRRFNQKQRQRKKIPRNKQDEIEE